jgi:hypothetical protein
MFVCYQITELQIFVCIDSFCVFPFQLQIRAVVML